MKKKLSKILGVGLALVLALALTVPVMANVTQPTVSIPSADDDISDTDVTYTITFQINDAIEEGDSIYVNFPDDTDISAVVDGDITVAVTSGISSNAGEVTEADEGLTTDVSDQVLTITLDEMGDDIGAFIGNLAWVQVEISGVDNPSEAGDYTLQVKTTDETAWIESAVYEISEPAVGGYVSVYNDSDVLLATYGGTDALGLCEDGGHFDSADYTIKVGPGTFLLTEPINVGGEGLTLISTDGAATTIIDADGYVGISITVADVTVDGFTIDDAVASIDIASTSADDVTIQNNVFTDTVQSAVRITDGAVTGATISGNTMEDGAIGIWIGGGNSDFTISDNTITESSSTGDGAIVFGSPAEVSDITVSGNTVSDNDGSGILFAPYGSPTYDNIVIEGNTISGNAGHGIEIRSGATITALVIFGNTIADNDDDGINLSSWDDSCLIAFNNITGNDDDGIDNVAGGVTTGIDATLNWWGTTDSDDIDAEFEDDSVGNHDWDPYLTAAVDAIFSGYHADANEDDIDGEDECGVLLVNVEAAATNEIADRLKVGKYLANPEAVVPGGSSDTPIAYYEVYVQLNDAALVSEPLTEISATLKLFASGIDGDTEAWVWSDATDEWAECSSYDYSEYGGYIYITLEDGTTPAIDELSGVSFALVTAPAPAPATFTLTAPEAGATVERLKNVAFTWASVTDAVSYELVLSANADLSSPKAEVTATGTAYTHPGPLTDDTPYYWQVTALDVDGDVEGKSDPATFTVKVPVEAEVVYTCAQCGLQFSSQALLESHIAQAHAPVVPTTPAYIWLIIGVGAVLVIAMIILIVRTRRVS